VLLPAHLGHWYVQIAFAVPSVVLITVMVRDSRRRKRERAARRPSRPDADA
jgi:membrane protein implicated in regulation of membrane protease activity